MESLTRQPVQQSWVPYSRCKIGSALQDFIVEAKENDLSHWLHQAHNVGETLQMESDEDYGSDDEEIPSASRGASIPLRMLHQAGVSVEEEADPDVGEGEII